MSRPGIGMGLRIFSMHPAQILNVKQKVLKSDMRSLIDRVPA